MSSRMPHNWSAAWRRLLSNTRQLALSPDGSRMAFVSFSQGKQQIYLRALDSQESKPISGTEGGDSPFFSPDGKWIGFLYPRDGKPRPFSYALILLLTS